MTTFVLDEKRSDLNPGEALFNGRHEIHGFSNDGDSDARFLAVISPGLPGSYFREVAEVFAGDRPPDLEKIGVVMRRYGLTPAPPA